MLYKFPKLTDSFDSSNILPDIVEGQLYSVGHSGAVVWKTIPLNFSCLKLPNLDVLWTFKYLEQIKGQKYSIGSKDLFYVKKTEDYEKKCLGKNNFFYPPYNFLRFKNKLTKVPIGIMHFYNQANLPDRIKTKNSIGIVFHTTAPLCPTLYSWPSTMSGRMLELSKLSVNLGNIFR